MKKKGRHLQQQILHLQLQHVVHDLNREHRSNQGNISKIMRIVTTEVTRAKTDTDFPLKISRSSSGDRSSIFPTCVSVFAHLA